VEVPRIVTFAVSAPCAGADGVADADGVAAGVGVAAGDEGVAGDWVLAGVAAAVAGVELALGVLADEQPLTATSAAAAKAAGTATRRSMTGIRGMRRARRVVGGVAAVFISCSFRILL
jgi:hypothetical protein